MAEDNNISDLDEKYKSFQYEWWMFEETYKLLSQLCENVSEQAEVASTGVCVQRNLTPQINANGFGTDSEAILTIKADPELLENILVECFLLHARTLYEFFLHEGGNHNIRAIDFIKNDKVEEWKQWRAGYRKDLEKIIEVEGLNFFDAVSKYLAHLVISRLEDKIKWKYQEIFSIFDEVKNKCETLKKEFSFICE